uniref:Uncharacterized protein n=1 Tax=Polytomella parva TaxID=51329 RepID=A0A7S0V2E5_9CHLO|mmetsp:Transcript_28944/g.53191  ORF Transcript_28944/g.53191 Transcript_28944/m.53191 type:complete len:532 (+) Transcript_28944:196-1791(+)|eukprot:CAMPEP_0175044652 /NCGR_PEP_ID=MMETSP0052_2-20121109/3940_1 /TAXON_ID=51329 ORGANISM="Polytomella parva, Strain SAG 63-3" /NCGR_SAMPLE_ID=MMETSP0052_2 /ASSEMBLY_ACC=CAM_ASM_000194 /LENGTH=531 /DNA_ID=CAMNT_0016308003 /DNA_START=8 /DNA_END=1603 /DNA_ORIENTATION=-
MQNMQLPKDMNPVWLAQSRLRRRKFDESLKISSALLEKNPYDQAVWFLKTRALTLKNWIDDVEIEEEGIADILMDENQIAQVPRPGTSMGATVNTSGGMPSQAVRPMTSSGRPVTGFARPGTGSARPTTSAMGRAGLTSSSGLAAQQALLDQALRSGNASNRPGTSRPVTSSGRFVRLGTASLLTQVGGPFIDVERLDLRKYAARPLLARALCDYIIYNDHNMKKALELCAHATQTNEFQDWWWKARLGKCYYQLGLLRDAEKQFKSSVQAQPMILSTLELCKIYLRMDQPNTAIEHYLAALVTHPDEVSLLLALARVHDALHEGEKAIQLYKNVLFYDSSNVEAVACLASYHFYSDQPEIALRYYRRLLQMGVTSCELWNNLGLCCFYSGQYDMCLGCFERTLQLAADDALPDIWFNIGQVAIGIGDLNLAMQCFKIAISIDPHHTEAYNNLGVLEFRRGNDGSAMAQFRLGQKYSHLVFEVFYNAALLSFKNGDFQDSYEMTQKALALYPEHTETHELLKQLTTQFASL